MERIHERTVQKDLKELDYYDDVVSHPEPDIPESKVKWTLGSTAVNKASGCNRIPAELFKTLKVDAIKVLHSICQQVWKTQQWPQDWKKSILILVLKKGGTQEYDNHQTIALIAHAHARLQHYTNQELPDLQVGFRKGRGARDQIANILLDHRESKGIQKKHLPLFHRLC